MSTITSNSLFHISDAEFSVALFFGLTAFTLQLIAYIWYSFEFFRGRMHLNVASWFMWFSGALVEYITFDAIDSKFSTSALPLACLLGIIYMGVVVVFLHIYRSIMRTNKYYFVEIEKTDLILVLIGVWSYGFFVVTENAPIANFTIVTASLLSFIPMWKSALQYGSEHPGPWVVMCFAYVAMMGAILTEGGEHVVAQSYYPIYFFILHLILALLAVKIIRSNVKAVYYTMKYRRKRLRNRNYGKR